MLSPGFMPDLQEKRGFQVFSGINGLYVGKCYFLLSVCTASPFAFLLLTPLLCQYLLELGCLFCLASLSVMNVFMVLALTSLRDE